jgi:hypothetical protein
MRASWAGVTSGAGPALAVGWLPCQQRVCDPASCACPRPHAPVRPPPTPDPRSCKVVGSTAVPGAGGGSAGVTVAAGLACASDGSSCSGVLGGPQGLLVASWSPTAGTAQFQQARVCAVQG